MTPKPAKSKRLLGLLLPRIADRRKGMGKFVKILPPPSTLRTPLPNGKDTCAGPQERIPGCLAGRNSTCSATVFAKGSRAPVAEITAEEPVELAVAVQSLFPNP